MNLIRVFAFAKKEILQIIRDIRSLTLAFLLPLIMVFLFSYAIRLDIREIPTAILDYSNSAPSRELIRKFTNSGYFVEVARPKNQQELTRLIDDGSAKVAITIPADFAEQLSRRNARIQTITDGADANTSQSTIAYTSMIVGEYNLERLKKAFGAHLPAELIHVNIRFWYNPELNSQHFVIPGLIALIMTILGALLTSMTISREWERGTMESLISTPFKPAEMALGKLLPYYGIGMVDLLLATYAGTLVFDIPLRGSLLLLGFFSTLFLAAALSTGYLISVFAKSQQTAFQFSMLVSFLPGLLLSGFLFPVSSMPKAVQFVSLLVPARYFITVLRDLFLKGSNFSDLWQEAVALTAFAVVFMGVAILSSRKRLS